MAYTYTYKKTRFRPRRPVRSFRDLEVYQKALEGAVAVAKNILPILNKIEAEGQGTKGSGDGQETKGNVGSRAAYPLKDEMLLCSLEIPRLIAEAHSARFDNKDTGLILLDKSMTDCNKMVVYLEQVRDIYTDKVERVVTEELIRKYIYNRRKIFNLYKAWKRFLEEDRKEGGK